nr:MAG: putative replicase protein [Leviviridae sp.]
MKSDEKDFMLGLYKAILEDILSDIPSLRVELDRDWSRLCSLANSRGLPVFTVDLPELGKHFDKCLSVAAFTASGLALSRPFRHRGVIPRLFKGLYLRVFHESGELRSDVDVLSIRYLRQLFMTAKKYKKECSNELVFRSVDEFFSIERAIRSPSLSWDRDRLGGESQEESVGYNPAASLHFGETCATPASSNLDLFDLEQEEATHRVRLMCDILQETADIISSTLGVFKPLTWRTKHGPGAVSDRNGPSKYSFPCWPDKLEQSFPLADFAFANYGRWSDYLLDRVTHDGRFSLHEPPSRLLAVPKTQRGPRLIASEPTAYQWCQQAIKDFFDRRIRATPIGSSISFRDQRHNQEAARQASQRTGAWTIDLSSASDRVSCYVVERFFRRNISLLSALHACRTRWIENSIGGERNPRYHILRKYTTMGSACTFPVETILFAGIAVSSLLYIRKLKPTIRNIRMASREVRVFGDDIIVPKDVGSATLELLGHLGFKVNPHKTFGTGKFRESCGLDVYSGIDVTPVYIMSIPVQTKPESVVSAVETRNNFYKSFYRSAAKYLESKAPRRYSIARVPFSSGTFGFVTEDTTELKHQRLRVCAKTHVLQVLAHIPIGKCKRMDDHGSSTLLQYFTERPSPETFWKGGVASRPSLKLRRRWVGF